MADVNPAPTPVPVHDVGYTRELCIYCLRNLCQKEIAKANMDPTDYSTYVQIVWNYSNEVIPYDQFQKQLKTLLERPDKQYRHLQPYWDVFHRGSIERMSTEDDPLFFYPMYLCSLLNSFDFFADPEQGNRIREHNRIEADRINAQIQAAYQHWCISKNETQPKHDQAPT